MTGFEWFLATLATTSMCASAVLKVIEAKQPVRRRR
jgi:hypothetical protein